MKKTLLILCMALSFSAFSQSYVGVVWKPVSLRRTPSMISQNVIRQLDYKDVLCVLDTIEIHGFYHVIDVRTNKEGYVFWEYVYLGDRIDDQTGALTQNGETQSENPTISITNNTEKYLTISLNNSEYEIEPHGIKTVTMTGGGEVYERASEAGVLPYIGHDNVETGHTYAWTFYIHHESKYQ